MKPVLISIRPLDQRTGNRIDIRAADGPSADVYGTAGVPWMPAIITRPTLTIELMSPDMDGRVQSGQARFELSLGLLLPKSKWQTTYWRGASVIIRSTGAIEGPSAVPDFWGYITSAVPNLDTGRLAVTAQVSTTLLDTPLLTAEFTGGGGITGDAEKRGVLLPFGAGTVKNIEPIWFDLVRNIGMIDGYGSTLSIDWLGEGLSSFGPRVADYPTYAALAAAIDDKTIPPGRWGSCVAKGLVGLGAPPAGVITVHATFASNRIGALMKRILLAHAKVPAERVHAAAFDTLDGIVDKPIGYWTATQRNVKDLLEALAQSCNATPLVTFQNVVTVTRAVIAVPYATLDRSGSQQPRVLNWASAEIEPPYYVLKARTARPARVLSLSEVLYTDTIEDKGQYRAGETYRAGNVVWLADKSQWLYINEVASSGHTPPYALEPDENGDVADAWWQRLQPPTTAADLSYADGTPLEELKPATPGATAGAPAGTNVGGVVQPDGTIVGGVEAAAAVHAIVINANSLIEQALRQDDAAEVQNLRDFIDGQPVKAYLVTFRNEQTTQNTAVNSVLTLLGAKTADGTAFIMDLDSVRVSPQKTLAQRLSEIAVDNGELTASVQQLMEAVVEPNGTGHARFLLRGTVGNGQVAIDGVADQNGSYLNFVSSIFRFVDPNGGNPLQVLGYSNTNQRWEFSTDVYARRLVADVVDAGNLKASAVQQTAFETLSYDISFSGNSTQRIFNIGFTKLDANSVLKVSTTLSARNIDDLQFTATITVQSADGSIVQSRQSRVNLNFVGGASQAQMALPLLAYFSYLPGGNYYIMVDVTNQEGTGDTLYIQTDSAIEIVELRKAAF